MRIELEMELTWIWFDLDTFVFPMAPGHCKGEHPETQGRGWTVGFCLMSKSLGSIYTTGPHTLRSLVVETFQASLGCWPQEVSPNGLTSGLELLRFNELSRLGEGYIWSIDLLEP